MRLPDGCGLVVVMCHDRSGRSAVIDAEPLVMVRQLVSDTLYHWCQDDGEVPRPRQLAAIDAVADCVYSMLRNGGCDLTRYRRAAKLVGVTVGIERAER